MAKVVVTKSKLDTLAQHINVKAGTSGAKTISQMQEAIDGITGKEAIEWHQCPEAVRNYLTNTAYDSSDYSESQIETYLTNIPADSKPVGKTVDGVTYYNEIPNKETPFSSKNKAGTVKPLDALRMINATHGVNIRDLGGWACDGGTIKYGKLFRGGGLYSGYKDELRAILCDQCGVRAELNLQGINEAPATSSVLGDDILYCRPEKIVWYQISDKTTWKEILRFIFDRIKDNQPVYYHCSAGADRTGTVSCIIEAILGVGSSDRDKDYELTSFAGENYMRKRTYASGNNTPGANWVGLINAIDALTSGTTFRDKVINWVASMGFTVDEINAFRTAMIDGTPEIITLDIGTCSVTSNLSNSLSDNSEISLAKYQPYSAVIVPKGGNIIKNITVTMGGVDVTGKYVAKIFQPNGVISIDTEGKYNVSEYAAAKVELPSYSVTKALGESTNSNAADVITKNTGYGAIIKANNGFKIKNITVTMGGVDVTERVTVGVEV